MLLQYFDNNKIGRTVFFIHGTASNNLVWEKQFKLLDKSGFRVISVDLRGHGSSKTKSGICTIDDHLNDLKETIDCIQITDKITFIGHSLGAVLALKFAERFPDMVDKLLLIGLPVKIPRILCLYYKWFLKRPFRFLKKKINYFKWLPFYKKFKNALMTDLNVLWQIWKDSLYWDFIANLPKVTCPVFLSVGRFDYISLKGQVKKLHSLLPNSSYKVFKWSSHNCMEHEPYEFNRWLLTVFAVDMEPA